MARERTLKVRVRTAKRRRPGSTRWLARQLNDPFVQRAQREGWRARSAFKLLEVDQKFRLLKRGARVLDLGSAPGGWAQVAAGRGCRVVGLDLLPIEPVEGATFLQGDIFDPDMQAQLEAALGGRADVLLSDLAASATGQRAVDRLRAEALGEAVLALVPDLLAPGGSALIKLVRGGEAGVTADARRMFRRIRLLRPEATRRDSSEIYLLGLDYRGGEVSKEGAGADDPSP